MSSKCHLKTLDLTCLLLRLRLDLSSFFSEQLSVVVVTKFTHKCLSKTQRPQSYEASFFVLESALNALFLLGVLICSFHDKGPLLMFLTQ